MLVDLLVRIAVSFTWFVTDGLRNHGGRGSVVFHDVADVVAKEKLALGSSLSLVSALNVLIHL